MKTIPLFISILILFSGCSGCSRSGRIKSKKSSDSSTVNTAPQSNNIKDNTDGATTIKMKRINGIYQIPVEVDGVPMSFIFDTGASSISISEVEALFLYKQGELSDSDVIGSSHFSDANGDISDGTIINLHTVKIGTRTLHNVEASVVHNLEAPLLFGQSALNQFGKISIDYKKGEITFE